MMKCKNPEATWPEGSPSVSACKCYHALLILWSQGSERWAWVEIALQLSSQDFLATWLLLQLEAPGVRGQPSCVEPLGREGFEKEAHPSSLFRKEDTAPRKGSRLPEVPQPLQTSACRLSRHQDGDVRQCHVCEGPVLSGFRRQWRLLPFTKDCSDTLVREPFRQPGLQWPSLHGPHAQSLSPVALAALLHWS